MAKKPNTTPHYGLTKPEEDDFYNIGVFNTNSDVIDAALHDHSGKTIPDGAHGLKFENGSLTFSDGGQERGIELFPHGPTPDALKTFAFWNSSQLGGDQKGLIFRGDAAVIRIVEPNNLANWFETVVVRNEQRSPTTPEDGVVVARNRVANAYDDNLRTFHDSVQPGRDYYYAAFTLNKSGAWNPENVKRLTFNPAGINGGAVELYKASFSAPSTLILTVPDMDVKDSWWTFRDYECIYFVFEDRYVYPTQSLHLHNTNLRAHASYVTSTHKTDMYVQGSRVFSNNHNTLTLNISDIKIVRTALSTGAISVEEPPCIGIYAVRKNNRP